MIVINRIGAQCDGEVDGIIPIDEFPHEINGNTVGGGDDFFGNRVASARAVAAHSREGQLIRPYRHQLTLLRQTLPRQVVQPGS